MSTAQVDNGEWAAADSVEGLVAQLASAKDRIANLEIAVQSNRTIGVAVGILVERLKLTEAGAFALLRGESQRCQTRLFDVAERLVHSGEFGGMCHRPTPSDGSSRSSEDRVHSFLQGRRLGG